MLYIIEDCLFYILTFANNRKMALLCLFIKGIDLVLNSALQAMFSAYHGTFNACLQNLM